jgi:hypothetical protein
MVLESAGPTTLAASALGAGDDVYGAAGTFGPQPLEYPWPQAGRQFLKMWKIILKSFITV